MEFLNEDLLREIYLRLDRSDRKVMGGVNKDWNRVHNSYSVNLKRIVTKLYKQLKIIEICASPYYINIAKHEHNMYLIMQMINDLPCLLYIEQSHIFLAYIPEQDVPLIYHLFETEQIGEINDYFIHILSNIRKNRPYYLLGHFYMETRLVLSIKYQGHLTLTEKDILALLMSVWKKYFNHRLPLAKHFICKHKEYPNTYGPRLTKNTDVILFQSPYCYKDNYYTTLEEFLRR